MGGAALAAVARRIGAPYPALVALAGAALALIPGVPTLVLDPELALALFVAPVLLDAAFDSSPRDLRANWRPIASLALGAVALTIIVVALVTHALVPGMPWAAAIALGAIVAPPDAAAATTVLKQLRPPHRLLVILEGESLFNDASALLVYRLAVGATATGFLSGWSVLPTLLVVTLGSVVLGLVLARVTILVNARIRDVATAVVFQFCGTFLVWILAERLHLSGIITMVVFAMAASRRAARAHPGAHPHPVVRGVGGRGVRAERARVHPRWVPAQVHRGARDWRDGCALCGGGGDGVRRGHPRAHRVGDVARRRSAGGAAGRGRTATPGPQRRGGARSREARRWSGGAACAAP